MRRDFLNQDQLDLLLDAGIRGQCGVPAHAVDDIHALRAAGLVEHDESRCLRLTLAGEHHVAAMGGKLTPRPLQ